MSGGLEICSVFLFKEKWSVYYIVGYNASLYTPWKNLYFSCRSEAVLSVGAV